MSRQRTTVFICIFIMSSVAIAKGDDYAEPEWRYKSACGPVSLWTACYTQGLVFSLEEICKRCGYNGGEACTVRQIHDAMRGSPWISVVGAKLSPNELKKLLSEKKSVIAFIRKKEAGEIDHAVCVIGQTESTLTIVDYPRADLAVSSNEFFDAWDGQSLVVSRTMLMNVIENSDLITAWMIVTAMLLQLRNIWKQTRRI